MNKRIRTSCQSQIDTCTRRTTKVNHWFQVIQTICLRLTSSKHNIHDITLNLLVNIYLTHDLTCLKNILCAQNWIDHHLLARDVLTNNLLLLLFLWITNHYLKHKTVGLRFWQWVGTLLLNWVLSCKHQEWLIQLICLLTDSDLTLLHSLQQRRLHFSWSTVDLICQYEISKDRSLLYFELL